MISNHFNITKIRAMFLMILMGFMFIKCEFSGADEIRGEKTSPVRSIELESVTVTAQKQEEKLQEVPVSITVFTDQDIEDKKIESLMDMADYVPNLMIFENGASGMNSPSMRGVHVAPYTLTATTGLYVDGVPILCGVGFEDEMLNIERIEVLRGPQGTLYGKNAETGAINIITRQPSNDLVGKASVQVGKLLSAAAGDREFSEFSFNVSGPIQKDMLFLGIAGKYKQRDGYIENTTTGDTVDDRERWAGRGHVRWTPSDRLDVSMTVARIENSDDGVNMTLGKNGAAAYGLPMPGDREVSSDFKGSNDAYSDTQALKVTYGLSDALRLTSITSRKVFNDKSKGDWDFSPATLTHTEKDGKYSKVSQEVRLDYAKGQVKWLAGLYYDKDTNDMDYETFSDYPTMAGITSREIDGDAYAAFANLTWPLTERLSVVTGLRYEVQNMDFEDNLDGRAFDDSWNALSPRAGLEYRFSPDIMGYATVSKGYRSGGFNLFAMDDQYASYDAEELWNYEIGMKSVIWDSRLMLNASVYYMDINDMQVEKAVNQIESYMTNAAEATGKGLELEMTARLNDGLTLMAGFGYSDIEFDKFEDALGDYKGNKNPYAPEYTYNIGTQYRHPGGFCARVDLIGYGEMYFDKTNEFSKGSYEIVNAKIGYETEHFDIYLYGKNIFDKEYNSYGYYGGYYTIYSDPGEVGLQCVYRF